MDTSRALRCSNRWNSSPSKWSSQYYQTRLGQSCPFPRPYSYYGLHYVKAWTFPTALRRIMRAAIRAVSILRVRLYLQTLTSRMQCSANFSRMDCAKTIVKAPLHSQSSRVTTAGARITSPRRNRAHTTVINHVPASVLTGVALPTMTFTDTTS